MKKIFLFFVLLGFILSSQATRPPSYAICDNPEVWLPEWPSHRFKTNQPGAPTYLKVIATIQEQRAEQQIRQQKEKGACHFPISPR